MEETTVTIADMCGKHMDKTIRFRIGGATYEGKLQTLNHEPASSYREQRAMLRVVNGEWSHIGHYDGSTPVTIIEEEVKP